MKFRYCLILYYLIVLSSCDSPKSYDLYAFLDDTNGLSTNSKIYVNGIDIGNLSSIEVINNKILAKLTINEKLKISRNSKFFITDIDLLSAKALKIVLIDSSGSFYNSNDTIVGTIEEDIRFNSIDSNTSKKIKPIIDSIVTLFHNVK